MPFRKLPFNFFSVASSAIAGSLVSLVPAAEVFAQPTAPSDRPTDNWILLYPQHPLYRKAIQQQQAFPSPTDTAAAAPAATSQPAIPAQSTPQPGTSAAQASPPVSPKSVVAPAPLNISPIPSVPAAPNTPVAAAIPSVTNLPPQPALYIDPVVPKPLPTREPKYYPGFGAGSPSAFGLNWGNVAAGLVVIDKEEITFDNPTSRKGDGSAAIAVGFGNSQDFLGLEAVYNIISLTPSRFAQNGSFDFKLHRYLGDLTAVAIGWENAANYGPDAGGTQSSVYGVVSKIFPLSPEDPKNPRILAVSAGVGGGRFRPFQDAVKGVGSIGVFANLGYQFLPNMSAIVDWTGRELNMGLSVVPFSNLPFTLTALALDVARNVGPQTRFGISAGVSLNFR